MIFFKDSLKAKLFALPMMVSLFSVGCSEDGGSELDLGERLEGQKFDLARIQRFINEEKTKLETFQQAATDSKLAVMVTDEMVTVSENLEGARNRNSELSDENELMKVEFDQYQARYRKIVRGAMAGTEIDLSSTKGDDYKSVRVMGVDPTAVKVYRSSGPEPVPIKDLPPALVEHLQMDEEEATRYVEKLAKSAKVRDQKFAEWKKQQVEKKSVEGAVVANEEYDKKMKEIRITIFEGEQLIRGRLREAKAWKSKASGLDARAAAERSKGRRPRSERLAELAREKADLLLDQNADARIVIARLKAQLEYLERLKGG